MRVLATEYSLSHKALEIYLSGCNPPHCPGCHNPETWDFNQGTPYQAALPRILQKIESFHTLIENVWILGGEPLDQDHKALECFLSAFQGLRPIWLFTRRELADIPEDVLTLCSYVKTGRYNQENQAKAFEMYGVALASLNQQIHSLNN